ncbi:MAG: glycosyltransferase family 4 protein [Fibrobacter sp.]|nr:glycosyltransferase family 4 protein [Fibrobacter sp.]
MPNCKFNKILVLSHEFPPFGGGGGRLLASLCDELHSRGFELTVLTAAPPEELRQRFPFQVKYFPTFRKALFKTSVPAMLLFLIQVFFFGFSRKARGYDFLFSNMAVPAGLVGVILRRILKIPHAVWYHGTEVTQNRPDGAGFFFRTMCHSVGKGAQFNFFVSKGLLDLALTYGPVPCPCVLPNAIRIHQNSVHKYTGGEKKFLFAARMEPVKNPLLLLEAVRILKGRGLLQGIRFSMFGSGALYRKVAEKIPEYGLENAVTLEQVVSFERMPELYSRSYALLIPSVIEGFPTTVLEAGAFGVPAIGTDTIGNRDAIIHEQTGLIVKLNDSGDLADAIAALSADSSMRNRLGENAFSRSKEFTIQRTADTFVSTLNSNL